MFDEFARHHSRKRDDALSRSLARAVVSAYCVIAVYRYVAISAYRAVSASFHTQSISKACVEGWMACPECDSADFPRVGIVGSVFPHVSREPRARSQRVAKNDYVSAMAQVVSVQHAALQGCAQVTFPQYTDTCGRLFRHAQSALARSCTRTQATLAPCR